MGGANPWRVIGRQLIHGLKCGPAYRLLFFTQNHRSGCPVDVAERFGRATRSSVRRVGRKSVPVGRPGPYRRRSLPAGRIGPVRTVDHGAAGEGRSALSTKAILAVRPAGTDHTGGVGNLGVPAGNGDRRKVLRRRDGYRRRWLAHAIVTCETRSRANIRRKSVARSWRTHSVRQCAGPTASACIPGAGRRRIRDGEGCRRCRIRPPPAGSDNRFRHVARRMNLFNLPVRSDGPQGRTRCVSAGRSRLEKVQWIVLSTRPARPRTVGTPPTRAFAHPSR